MDGGDRLKSLVKAYDIRGIVPDELDQDIAEALGVGFVQLLKREGPTPRIVIAHDMRESGPGLAEAFARGANREGVDVIHAGLGSTDLLYFASGIMGLPGAMLTASHNPAQYNGIKLCRAGAAPIGQESGLIEIRDAAA
ncbi:MAG: phosphomannomutase/phosphoglucomutase, partial [Micromonosporaceae bacterium]